MPGTEKMPAQRGAQLCTRQASLLSDPFTPSLQYTRPPNCTFAPHCRDPFTASKQAAPTVRPRNTPPLGMSTRHGFLIAALALVPLKIAAQFALGLVAANVLVLTATILLVRILLMGWNSSAAYCKRVILVGCGNVGAGVGLAFARAGYLVTTVDPSNTLVPAELRKAPHTYHKLRVEDVPESMLAEAPAAWVVYAADCGNRDSYAEDSTLGARQLAVFDSFARRLARMSEAAAACRRLVYIGGSWTRLAADDRLVPPLVHDASPSKPMAEMSPYEAAKNAACDAARALSTELSLPITFADWASVVPNYAPNFSIAKMTDEALAKGSISYSAGDVGRPLCQAEDAGRALVALCEREANTLFDTVLIPGEFTPFERFARVVLDTVRDETGSRPELVAHDDAPPAALRSRCESVRLAAIGWEPDAGAVEKGLRDTCKARLRAARHAAKKTVVTSPVATLPMATSPVLSARQRCLTRELLAKWEEEQQFTAEQNATMEAFRKALIAEDLMQEWLDNKPMWFRFCQARQWNLPKALAMIKETLAWRARMGMDFIDTSSGPTPRFLIEFVYPELAEIKKAYNFTHHRMDKNGMPVYFDRLGLLDYGKMVSAEGSTPDRVLQYFVWYAEATWHYRLPAASLASGRYIGKGLYVMDLSGFALATHSTKDTRNFITSFIKVASDNYPETIHKTYIINAPLLFRTAWAFVSGLLDERQRAKFSIMGDQKEYLPKLLEVMDLESIPVQFGGTDMSCTFYEEQGPWQELMPSPSGPRVAWEACDCAS